MKRKILLKIFSPIVIFPASLTLSCSQNNADDKEFQVNDSVYSQQWNLALDSNFNETIFNWKLEDFEKSINNYFKNNEKEAFKMRMYVFSLLWDSMNSPLDEKGQVQNNLSKNIKDFASFLRKKIETNNEKNPNNDFDYINQMINTFDFKISLINFDSSTGKINNNVTLKEIFNNQGYILNFKIQFQTSDSEVNSKMLDENNKSIMFKTILSREQNERINSVNDNEIKTIVENQYVYQSTKLFFNKEQKSFETIVLPSNVHRSESLETKESGFSTQDQKRKLFYFDWFVKKQEENSDEIPTLKFVINFNEYFVNYISSDWTKFLEYNNYFNDDQEKSTSKISDIRIKLT